MRPANMSAGTCLSTLIAAPTFPRTVPRTSTLQRQSRTSSLTADNNNGLPVDSALCNSPSAVYHHQRQSSSQTFVDGPRSQPSSRQTHHQNAVPSDHRSVCLTHLTMLTLLFTFVLYAYFFFWKSAATGSLLSPIFNVHSNLSESLCLSSVRFCGTSTCSNQADLARVSRLCVFCR